MAIKKSLNEYKIIVAGKQKGVPIPINHRLVVTKGRMGGNAADDGYELWIEILTFKDSSHPVLLFNDMFKAANKTFPLGATLPTKPIEKVIATELEKELNNKIGTGKWQKIK